MVPTSLLELPKPTRNLNSSVKPELLNPIFLYKTWKNPITIPYRVRNRENLQGEDFGWLQGIWKVFEILLLKNPRTNVEKTFKKSKKKIVNQNKL